MRVAVDISLYPLDRDFIPPIEDVIERFHGYPALEVSTNRLSTQIFGDYDEVMRALHAEMRTTFERIPKGVFTLRILNNPVAGEGE